jgi:hypothetical protein
VLPDQPRALDGGCLCGRARWHAEGGFERAVHCHCSQCRKAHGSAYATWAATPERGFSSTGTISRFEASAGFLRCFCARCGSMLPGAADDERRFVPLAGCDADPAVRAQTHVFVASKAPWFDACGALPRFDAILPGHGALARPDPPQRPAGAGVRGSCLCGDVAFEIHEPATLARFCHCSRCRKARAAAHAANLFVPASGLRFTRGAARLVSYKIPEALRFTQCFCERCGGKLPRVDPERQLAVVPMGALDDDPGIRPSAHIFVGSKAAWDEIGDGLPQQAELPPG